MPVGGETPIEKSWLFFLSLLYGELEIYDSFFLFGVFGG